MEIYGVQSARKSMFKILININSMLLPTRGHHVGYISGVGRSTRYLVDALANLDAPDIKISTCLESNRHLGKYTQSYGCEHHWTFLPYKYSHLYRFFLNYDLYHFPDNFFASYRPGEKFVITIHDTILYEEAVASKNVYRMSMMENNVRDCLGIVTCSNYSKKRILDCFDVNPEKICVIPWGVDTQMFRAKTQKEVMNTLSNYNIRTPYFLAVSCREERKNMRNLLKAFRRYSYSHSASLVLIWGNPPFEIINEYSLEIRQGKIRFIDYVTDEQLVDLYNGAIGTMFPSRQEGFGFPIIESYACGTPVMTCRNSSLMEVGGDYAHYVGEDDIEGMASVMDQLVKTNKLEFQNKVSCYVARYSWEETAKRYLEFYKYYCHKK